MNDKLKELEEHSAQIFELGCMERPVYLKEDVDAAIAELKKKLMPCLNGDCILTCEVVEKYGKENAELKQKLEDAQASAYAESVDAGMRERRLKRALWLTRAERAIAEQTIDKWSRYREKHPLGSWRVDPFDYWVNAWINVEKLCRKKAEEYK